MFHNIAAWNVHNFHGTNKIFQFKQLIKANNFDLICILECRAFMESLKDPLFLSQHSLYEDEGQVHNFLVSLPCRIWI